MTALIIQRLDAIARASPELKSITVLYKSILPILRDAEIPVEPVLLDTEQARVKL